MPRVVLVTGVARPLGGRVARAIAADAGVDRVIGVDRADAAETGDDQPDVSVDGDVRVVQEDPNGRYRFIRADIRSPAIGRLLTREQVDTVVHLGAVAGTGSGGNVGGAAWRSQIKETNIIGAMQLLAACQRLGSLRRFVLRSSAAVYGASPDDPAMFTEDCEPRRPPPSGYGRDALEIERYVRAFARHRPDVSVATLRFTNTVAPEADTELLTHLSLPIVPTVLGFNPRLQFVHSKDVVAALHRAVASDLSGVVNVSGEGVLTLAQALARLGRPALPVPGFAFRPMRQAYRTAGLRTAEPSQKAYLSYGGAVDTSRMRDDLKFVPEYDTAAAFECFATGRPPGMMSAERVRAAESGLEDLLGR